MCLDSQDKYINCISLGWYFAGICRKDGQAAKVESVSSPEKIRAYVESGSWKQADLLELLYCKDGCHHGDGVQTE